MLTLTDGLLLQKMIEKGLRNNFLRVIKSEREKRVAEVKKKYRCSWRVSL